MAFPAPECWGPGICQSCSHGPGRGGGESVADKGEEQPTKRQRELDRQSACRLQSLLFPQPASNHCPKSGLLILCHFHEVTMKQIFPETFFLEKWLL